MKNPIAHVSKTLLIVSLEFHTDSWHSWPEMPRRRVISSIGERKREMKNQEYMNRKNTE